MAHLDLPLRSRKDLARAAQLRSLALGRPARSALATSYDDTYLPSTRRRPDRSINNNPYYRNPLNSYLPEQQTLTSPYSDMLDFNSTNYHPASTPNPYRPTTYPRRNSADHLPARLPFAKAARALYYALDNAIRYAECLEPNFAQDMRLLPYADERTRAHLWKLKLEYRGSQDAEGPPDDKADFFPKQASRLLDAIDDVRDPERPDARDLGAASSSSAAGYSGGLGMEDVRLAVKKLGVSFGAVAELLEGVRAEKARCAVLVRELKSALAVLVEIKGVWELRRRNRFGGGGAAGLKPIPVPAAFSEDDWENSSYRGD